MATEQSSRSTRDRRRRFITLPATLAEWEHHPELARHDRSTAITAERAIEVWSAVNAEDIRIMGLDTLEVRARLITEPFVTG